ncbi:MAG: diguanylate cyclase, partial [Aquabacterium sp.]
RKILENIRQPVLLPDRTLEVGTSIGVAFSDASCTEAGLTAKADDALYEAKRAGRNTYRMAQG